MSIAQTRGAASLQGEGWGVAVLAGAPLIAPARQFVFPRAIPGEEDALARGALWLDLRLQGSGAWMAQCALGFAGVNVAQGLWPLPERDRLLACAGGYAYEIMPGAPEQTRLLPPRPAVAVLPFPERTVLVTHHGLQVREAGGELWETPRLSWEGVSLLRIEGDRLIGTGWNLIDDAEVAFAVDLHTREAIGGGFASS